MAACFVPPHKRAQPRLFCKVYFTKKHIFNIFFKKYLDMSKKSTTFAPDLKKTLLTTKI